MSQSVTHLTPDERQTLFENFLRCIDREENLIHYRLTWGLQWNLASFGALFALQQISIENNFKFTIYILISFFGIVATILSIIGIAAAHLQAEFLIKSINRRLGVTDDNWDSTEFIRPYGDPATIHRPARWVSKFLPLLFILIWIFVFLWAYPEIAHHGR